MFETNPASQDVICTIDGNVARVRFNRPAKHNALTSAMCRQVTSFLQSLIDDKEVRVVLFEGTGSSFCSGMDLDAKLTESTFSEDARQMLDLMQTLPKPVVANIQGPAVGAGVQVSLACDLRVVGKDAWFRIPPARLGIAVDSWTIRRAAELFGPARARVMLLAAERIPAEEAFACRFASILGDSAAAEEFVAEVAALAPLSLQHAKVVLNNDATRDAELANEREAFAAVWKSEDLTEAFSARAQKRRPVFKGQ
ncbi:enoyl-CoA hydratase [Corynebacterium ulceribovis]|uniref:enoyl-CoA hydratase n=1 Tax=Corynebacterium ulceribovis TaxID=487732 RepID=UPI0003601750|nr:enoyl-CoA hydratase [Corynebacterium ulceribovis]